VDVRNIVLEVQDILDSLVLEMEQRTPGFMVDPGGKLLEALRGTDTVAQLENAWKYLTNRLFEGGRHIDKYYKQDREEDVDSPRSTDPGFFDQEFYNGSVTDALCKHLSHPRQWTELGLGSSPPLDSLPALEYLRPINPVLLKKFPPRHPESSPKTYTYNTESGELEQAFNSLSSSHNASREWAPPPLDRESAWVNEDRGLHRTRARKDVTFAADSSSSSSSDDARQTQSALNTPYTPYKAFKTSDQMFQAQPRHALPPSSTLQAMNVGDSNFLYGLAQPRISTTRLSLAPQTCYELAKIASLIYLSK